MLSFCNIYNFLSSLHLNILNALPYPIVVWLPDYTIMFANESYCSLVGIDDYRNTKLFDYEEPENIVLIFKMMKSGQPSHLQTGSIKYRHKNNDNEITITWTAIIIQDPHEKPIAYMATGAIVENDESNINEKEIIILQMLAVGNTNKQIAKYLGTTDNTVGVTINRIKQKANCKTKDDLIQYYNDKLAQK